jgi:serine/threonine protein kinase
VHLDLNPENILVNNERELSLNADDPTEESGFQIIQSGGAPLGPTLKKEREPLLSITNFFMSSGIDKIKFSSNKISSLYFMAPERILANVDLNKVEELKKCDMWSIGVLLYFLMFGEFPFDGENRSKLARCIKSG